MYKALTAHSWAPKFGTAAFACRKAELLSAHFATFPDPDKAQRLFHALETARLDACSRATCPGFIATCRRCKRWRAAGGASGLDAAAQAAAKTGASVHDSLALMTELYAGELPMPRCYQGKLFVERVEKTLHERRAREKNAFREALTHLGKEATGKTATGDTSSRFKVERKPDTTQPSAFRFTLTLDGQPVAPPADVRALMDSILQDLGQIPDEYSRAPPATQATGARTRTPSAPRMSGKAPQHEEGALAATQDHRRALP